MTTTTGSGTPRSDTGRSSPGVAAALAALALGGFGIGTTEFATMGLLPEVSDSFDISIPTAGHAITAYALGVVIGAPIITVAAARLPRKGLLIGLMVAFTVGNALSALATGTPFLIAARFASGLPHGAYFGIASVVAASLVPPGRKGRAVSRVMVGLTIANIIGVPAATLLGQHLGWRYAYAVVALTGVLTICALQRWVPAAPPPRDGGAARELTAFRRPQVWLAIATGMVGFGGMFALYSYIAPTMTDVTGLSDGAVPWVLATFGLGMTAGALVAGRFIDRSVMGTICGSLVGVSVVLALFALTAGNPVAAVTGVLLVGFTSQFLASGLQVRLMEASPDAPSLASSSNHSALNVANAAGAWLGGLVISAGHGYRATAWVGVALSLAGLVIALVSVTVERRARAASQGAATQS